MIKIARQPLDNMISNDLKKRKIEDAKDLEHMFEDSLPPKFAFLDQVFASLERVCLLYHGRRLTTVTSIRDTLESMMSRSIEVSTLEMIETLFPSAYVYEYKRIIDPEEGSNKFEWVITPNFKQKDLLGMEKESRSRIDTFRDKLLNFAKKNQISNFMDYPMKDEFFNDVERTPVFMDCETKNGKNKSLTVDEMLLGKDHPLMKKKRETRKTYESMTLKVKNGYHESTELDLSNVPKELGDINPTLVYLSRQNEKHYQEVANPEYMEREKQRKILKSILELCERMNSYYTLKGKKTENLTVLITHLTSHKKGYAIDKNEIVSLFEYLHQNIGTQWCSIFELRGESWVRIDKSHFVNTKGKIKSILESYEEKFE